MADRRFPDDVFPVIVAHRGASSSHPENTMPSFAAALELGAPVVEFDVRLTADGVPVVIHDPDVDRTTDGTGWVHELTAEQVAALRAGSAEEPAGVPRLDEVLDLLSGRAAAAIEIKNLPWEPGYQPDGESLVEVTLAEIERTRFEGPVLVLSFDPRSIAVAKARMPGLTTGFLTTHHVDVREALAHAVEVGHDFVLPGTQGLVPAGSAFVEEAHAAGVRVGTWTVDDAATLTELLDAGVDAIASNDPGMALAVVAARRG
jgi:glycerophosphoryl diester phosphodiesterase